MRPGHAGDGVVIKMDLNRAALKADARRRAAGYRPSPILAALIVFALSLLISTLSSYLMGADRLTTALTNAAQFGAEAVEQAYISFLSTTVCPPPRSCSSSRSRLWAIWSASAS